MALTPNQIKAVSFKGIKMVTTSTATNGVDYFWAFTNELRPPSLKTSSKLYNVPSNLVTEESNEDLF